MAKITLYPPPKPIQGSTFAIAKSFVPNIWCMRMGFSFVQMQLSGISGSENIFVRWNENLYDIYACAILVCFCTWRFFRNGYKG